MSRHPAVPEFPKVAEPRVHVYVVSHVKIGVDEPPGSDFDNDATGRDGGEFDVRLGFANFCVYPGEKGVSILDPGVFLCIAVLGHGEQFRGDGDEDGRSVVMYDRLESSPWRHLHYSFSAEVSLSCFRD